MDFKNINENIGKNLKILRKLNGLTQEQVIEKIGEENISLRSYKSYESGTSSRMPSLDKLIILSNFFRVSLDLLIFSISTTRDDSYSAKDNLKRLARLIYSMVLQPVKEKDPNHPHYGKYYFCAVDNEVKAFLDKFEVLAFENNNFFEYKNIVRYRGISDFDEIINKTEGLEENWAPTYERFKYILALNGEDPDEYEKNHMEEIAKKREINSILEKK